MWEKLFSRHPNLVMVAKYLMTQSNDSTSDYEFGLFGLYVGQNFPITIQKRQALYRIFFCPGITVSKNASCYGLLH